jgi:hypothetical protein
MDIVNLVAPAFKKLAVVTLGDLGDNQALIMKLILIIFIDLCFVILGFNEH